MALFSRVVSSASTGINSRLSNARSALNRIKQTDSTNEANPNLVVGDVNLAQHLAQVFEEIIKICEYYLAEVKEWDDTIKGIEEEKQELEKENHNQQTQFQQIFNLISPDQPYNFTQLQQEIKRLKIQDLTIQIPLKKQELEQNINILKQKLTRAEQYPLEKLLKKHAKTLQGNNNTEKLNELKEILSEKLTSEELQTLLNKQKEVFNLEKHLESLQTEQVAQILQPTNQPYGTPGSSKN